MRGTGEAQQDLLREARGWLADCGDPEAYGRPDWEVQSLVRRLYDGGWDGFVLDGIPVQVREVT